MPEPRPRPHANRGAVFDTVWEADEWTREPTDPPAGRPRKAQSGATRGGPLPPDLRRYGGHLTIPLRPDRPTVLVNFVESLDGVVTVDPEHGSGAEISGFNEPDRFVMGLLRAVADVIVLGAGTLRAAPNHTWTPRRVNPAFGDAYDAWRSYLRLAPAPTTLIVTGSGDLPTDHPALRSHDIPTIVVAPAAIAPQLRASLPPWIRVEATNDDGRVSARSIVAVAAGEGARVLLSEGGPHLTGTFAREGLLDDLFLTLAPQVLGRHAGRSGAARLSFVEGVAFDLETAPWASLRSVRRSVDHLFLRYRFGDDA